MKDNRRAQTLTHKPKSLIYLMTSVTRPFCDLRNVEVFLYLKVGSSNQHVI
jgi:hypothetical protein